MTTIKINEQIAFLRKQKGLTQEELASALGVTNQAVSKWESAQCCPDIQLLPDIARLFDVSVDELIGYKTTDGLGDIYEKVFEKVNAYPQMSRESYEEALRLFARAHHGISRGNMRFGNEYLDGTTHISNENGLSLLSGKGYGAIVTRQFFESVDKGTLDLAAQIFHVLANRDCLTVCLAVISTSGISFGELSEKTGLAPEPLRAAVDSLRGSDLIVEKRSKHESLGYIYEIGQMYHTCLCIMFATLEVQRISLEDGISCCMGYGDYPINL